MSPTFQPGVLVPHETKNLNGRRQATVHQEMRDSHQSLECQQCSVCGVCFWKENVTVTNFFSSVTVWHGCQFKRATKLANLPLLGRWLCSYCFTMNLATSGVSAKNSCVAGRIRWLIVSLKTGCAPSSITRSKSRNSPVQHKRYFKSFGQYKLQR